eukprot:scaffold258426_cov30-Tisochrysis_lutea.AAC.3
MRNPSTKIAQPDQSYPVSASCAKWPAALMYMTEADTTKTQNICHTQKKRKTQHRSRTSSKRESLPRFRTRNSKKPANSSRVRQTSAVTTTCRTVIGDGAMIKVITASTTN